MVFENSSNNALNSIGSTIAVIVVYQLIPVILTIVIYTLVAIKLRRMSRLIRQGSVIDRKRREQAVRTVTMLVAILTSYFLLSLPVAFFINAETFRLGQRNTCDLRSEFYSHSRTLSAMANIVNPFILCYFNNIIIQQALQTFCGGKRAIEIESQLKGNTQDTDV